MSSFAQLEHYNKTGDTQGGAEGEAYESSKRAKLSSARSMDAIPSSVMANFLDQDGHRAGPQVNLPSNSTAKQLEILVNSLLQNESPLPYAFYINDVEVVGSVTEALHQLEQELSKIADAGGEDKRLSYEDSVTISYQPLSVFRVRPVTRCIETMPGHTDAVLHVSFSPDGKRLASGGGDMAVRFWNTTTHLPMHVCTGHKHHVLCTSWSPDHGSVFVSADRSGEIRLWDANQGLQLGSPLRGHSKWVTAIAFEPLHSGDGQIRRFCTSSKDHSVKVWNVRTGSCMTTICGHSDSIEAVRWGGSGLIYTASRDRSIKVWAVDGDGNHGSAQHKLVRTLHGHAHRINTLALNCDYVLRTGAISLDSMAETSKMRATKNTNSGGDTSTGLQKMNKEIADRRAARVAAAAADEKTSNESHSNKLAAGVDIAADNAKKMSEVLALVPAEVATARKEAARVRYVGVVGSVTNAGERLVSGSDDFTLIIWAPQESKAPLQRLTGHQQMVTHVCFSPDARHFASASFDKKVKIWDGNTGKFLATCHGHVGSVYQLSWSADSGFLVSASKDSTLKLWNASGGFANLKKSMHTLPGHEDEVFALDWSPDGRCLASGSKDRTIKIWHH